MACAACAASAAGATMLSDPKETAIQIGKTVVILVLALIVLGLLRRFTPVGDII